MSSGTEARESFGDIPPPLVESMAEQFAAIVGPQYVDVSDLSRITYSRDRAPIATYHVREGKLPRGAPSAIVQPASHDEVAKVVSLANSLQVAVIPFGAGSGVVGGTIPHGGEVMVDLKRLNRVLRIDETDALARVEAGLNGTQFEAVLNSRGYTSGHLPQSIHMSTVGGWVACRGAGQASTKYGKIEDRVLGLTAVLPDGQSLSIRPAGGRAVGPGLKDLFVGSEGVFGIITDVTLAISRKPECEAPLVVAFPRLEDGLEAIREILQAELRPSVIRLYDRAESAKRTQNEAQFESAPYLCLLQFSGLKAVVDVELNEVLSIVRRCGAKIASHAAFEHWQSVRYLAYSSDWQARNHFMDTIEVTLPWSQVMPAYKRMNDAVNALYEEIYFSAHWSHFYPSGACQYMTFRLPPMEFDCALDLHKAVWDVVMKETLSHGGSISHHHGIGVMRENWLKAELGAGHGVLQKIKNALDPGQIMNPGKLGLAHIGGS